MNLWLIIALIYTTYAVVKLKPDNTGAVLFQLSYQVIWEHLILWVCNIPVEGEECKWLYIWTAEESLNKTLLLLSINVDQLSVGLIPQSVEHYADMAEVVVRILFKPEIFSGLDFKFI